MIILFESDTNFALYLLVFLTLMDASEYRFALDLDSTKYNSDLDDYVLF